MLPDRGHPGTIDGLLVVNDVLPTVAKVTPPPSPLETDFPPLAGGLDAARQPESLAEHSTDFSTPRPPVR